MSCGVNSATPESFGEWGKTRRADGRIISLALSRLPNGATLIDEARSPESFWMPYDAALLELGHILADAQLPERYAAEVGLVDLLYQDIAQRGQAQIFGENADACLAPSGTGLLMLKVRSVTQSRSAGSVVDESRRELARLHARPSV